MLAYVLDKKSLKTKDILEFETYCFKTDIEYEEKSSIKVSKKPCVADDDFIVCKDGNKKVFIGICNTCKNESSSMEYEISMLQKEALFDQDIFLEDEYLIQNVGIEDFIVAAIVRNFISSGDELMDKVYLSANAMTHTKIAAKVDTENGIFNLKTYLGNAKEYYGVFIDFEFSEGKLKLSVYKNAENTIPIDIETSDISDYKETYSVSVIAKLGVLWKRPDSEDEFGNVSVGPTSKHYFYLLSDRTISEDVSDLNRADGITKCIYIEAETEDEMRQQAYNEFTSNKYSHKIVFNLQRNSRLYPEGRFYVGRTCMSRTQAGVKSSLVTKSEIQSQNHVIKLTFGKLKVTLIEKVRRR